MSINFQDNFFCISTLFSDAITCLYHVHVVHPEGTTKIKSTRATGIKSRMSEWAYSFVIFEAGILCTEIRSRLCKNIFSSLILNRFIQLNPDPYSCLYLEFQAKRLKIEGDMDQNAYFFN